MEFFGMGFGEILLILVIAIIILGPGKIVNVAKGLGKLVYNIKKATSDVTMQINKEIQEQEKAVSEGTNQITREAKGQGKSALESTKEIVKEIRDIKAAFKNDKPISGN